MDAIGLPKLRSRIVTAKLTREMTEVPCSHPREHAHGCTWAWRPIANSFAHCSSSADRPLIETGALFRWLGGVLLAALVVCGMWLMARRLSGSFAAPLQAGPLVLLGALAVAWAAIGRLLWKQEPASRWQTRIMDWAPTVGLVLVATSAVLPGSAPIAVVLVGIMIVAEEVAASLLGRRSSGSRSSMAVADPRHRRDKLSRPLRARSTLNEPASSHIRQQQTRRRTADGHEAIEGTFRAAFSIGQRVAIEHLVFCPMLDRVPKISAVVLDELESSARATHVYRYGARLEVKLSEPCEEPLDVLVQYDVCG